MNRARTIEKKMLDWLLALALAALAAVAAVQCGPDDDSRDGSDIHERRG